MGLDGDRRKLKKKLGVEFDDERLKIIRNYSRDNGIDLIESGQQYLDLHFTKLYEEFEEYDNDYLNLLDFDREDTKKLLIKLFEGWVNQLESTIIKLLKKVDNSHHNLIINTFFGVIKKVKNNHLFWVIYGRIFQTYELTSLHLEKFKELVTEERLTISLRDRTYLCNSLQLLGFNLKKCKDVDELLKLNTSQFFYSWTTFSNFVDEICEKNDEDTITVYRGFKVNKDQRILDDEGKQINGQGLSYTIDKDKTIFFGIRYLYYYNLISKLYKDINKNKWLSDWSNNFTKNGIDKDKFEKDKSYRDDVFYESELMKEIKENISDSLETKDLNLERYRRGYIGTYTVKRKDIWFLSNIDDEKEVVVSNDKVDVKNYKVITFEDYKKYNLDIKQRHKSYFLESK